MKTNKKTNKNLLPILPCDDFFRLQRVIEAQIYREENYDRAVILASLGRNYEGMVVLDNHDAGTRKLRDALDKLCRLFESQYENK